MSIAQWHPRGAVGLAVFVVVVMVAALPSAALAGGKEPVSFNFWGWEIIQDREVTAHGANTVRVSWHFPVMSVTSAEPSICCDAGLDPTWTWNTKTSSGTVSGTWQSHHYFEPFQWEGRLSGRMTAAGGEGILHMKELNSGAIVNGTWTSEPVDPLEANEFGLQVWSVEVTGALLD